MQAGSISKAIELAFRTQQFGALQMISEDLDERTDPDMLNKCAEFFIDHGQFDRAVNLLIVAKRVSFLFHTNVYCTGCLKKFLPHLFGSCGFAVFQLSRFLHSYIGQVSI